MASGYALGHPRTADGHEPEGDLFRLRLFGELGKRAANEAVAAMAITALLVVRLARREG